MNDALRVTEFEASLERAGVDAQLRIPLARYGAIVLEANQRFNLTGAKTPDDFATHIVDSLSLLPYVREPFVDIGSGAGLPAIPIAIAIGIPVTMIEATRKKAVFLESLLATLTLAGEVVAERAESAARDARWREHFASGTARAVAAAPVVAELLLPFIAPGGVAILQRAAVDPRERIALDDASLVLGGRVEAEDELGGERRILLVRKIGATPARFPRRAGIPEKRPLCM